MKLLFKQRMFSWFDSYDIYNEQGDTAFTVKGQLAWGHKLVIYDPLKREVGTVREKVLTLLPQFELFQGGRRIGVVQKELTFLRPRYWLDYQGWQVQGDLMGWDYGISDRKGQTIATISKELFRLTDTYVLTIQNPEHALLVLMIVLAIDAANCSQSK